MSMFSKKNAEILVFLGAWTLAIMLYKLSPAAEFIEHKLLRPLEFKTRELFDLAPQLDSRIKLLTYRADRLFPSNTTLLKTLEKIAARNPHSIYIDNVWSFFAPGKSATFTQQLAQLSVPLVISSRISEFGRRDNLMVSIDSEKFSSGVSGAGLPYRIGIPYSIDNQAVQNFARIGQDENYSPGYVYPMLSFGSHLATSSSFIVPHVALLAAGEELATRNGKAWFNGQELPVDDNGLALVNFPRRRDLRTRSQDFADLLLDFERGFLSSITANDVVAILPEVPLSAQSERSSYIGTIKSSWLTVAFLNSVMTRQWLTPLPFDNLIAFLCCLFGLLTVRILPRKIFFAMIYVAIAGVGMASFMFFDMLTTWPLWAVGFYLGVRSDYFLSMLSLTEENFIKGTVPRNEPAEHLVSVMFIDMVGFSMSSEDLTPRLALSRLSSNITYLKEKIYRYGGEVNKTLGDGLLAYFGYPVTSDNRNHAEAALNCAIEIQQDCLQRCVEKNDSLYTYPLRIGINTDLVYIGVIGDDRDISLVGSAVIFASRLEASCEPFRIMLGSTTRKFLSENFLAASTGLNKRWVKIKHYEKLFEAYEYNPFHGDLVKQSLAKRSYRTYLKLDKDRNYRRWPIPDREALTMRWSDDQAAVINVSNCGFAIETSRYLAKGVVVEVMLHSSVDLVEYTLQRSGLLPFRIEIKWGQPVENSKKFKQGVRAVSLNHEQGEILLNICLGVLPASSASQDDSIGA